MALIYIGSCSKGTKIKKPPVTPAPAPIATCPITNNLCLNGCCPVGAPQNNFLVDHSIYYLSSNRTTKFADWVAYKVVASNLTGPSRDRNWMQDPAIPPEYTLSPDDYTDANATCGYDRGHQAPLSDFSNNPAWNNANYLSNITPQKSILNQNAWNNLENAERKLVSKYSNVYIVTGPYYTSTGPVMCPLPKSHLPTVIPNGYWKVITVSQEGSNNITAAFQFEQNTPKNDKYCTHLSNLSQVEEKSHLNTLPNSAPQNTDNSTLIKALGC